MARQEINTFYQRLKAGPPTFDVRQDGAQSVCLLTLPAVDADAGAVAATSFTGTGTSKKAATAHAAEQGLAFLQQQPAFKASKPSGALWDVIAKLLTPEVLRKEPEFEGHVLLAHALSDGWLPLQLLAVARPVTAWAKQQLPAALASPEAFLTAVQQHLQAQPASQVPASLEADARCRALRRREPYTGRAGFDVATALAATVARGAGRRFACVLVPADGSAPVREVGIEGGGHLWNSLAGALGCGPTDLLYWDKVGTSHKLLLGGPEAAEQLEDPGLLALLAQHLGPLPNNRPLPAADGGAEAAGEGATDEAGSCFTEVRPPALYSRAGDPRLNMRAASLARRPVHGDALLSFCRLRPCEWRTPSVKWAALPLPVFGAWLAAGLPAGRVAAAAAAPLLAALPHTFRSPRAWTGPLPSDVLSQQLPPELCAAPLQLAAQAASDDPDAPWECAASVQPLGQPLWRAEAADCAGRQAASQQAALALLRRLDAWLRALWAAGCPALGAEAAAAADGPELQRLGGVEPPAAGGLVDFQYRLEAADGRTAGRLLAAGAARTCWESGDLLPPAAALLAACRPGGAAACALRLPAAGLAPGACLPGQLCRLTVEAEARVRWVGLAHGGGPALFSPPLSAQRCERVARILAEAGARSVVDVGCGDGRLLEHLARQAAAGGAGPRSITGLDVAAPAARRGAARLRARNPGLLEGPEAPHVRVFAGDAVCGAATQPEAWGGLLGADAAVFQEVVEHLDPGPLAGVGACLLGGLQPAVLVVTTPNREYNALLHGLQAATLPNGLRNSDHRFEWTRAEFQEWGDSLAGRHGYSVTYEGLGRAVQDLGEEDLGLSTQVAVFRREAEAPRPQQGDPSLGSLLFDSRQLPGDSPMEAEGEAAGKQSRGREAEMACQAAHRRRV